MIHQYVEFDCISYWPLHFHPLFKRFCFVHRLPMVHVTMATHKIQFLKSCSPWSPGVFCLAPFFNVSISIPYNIVKAIRNFIWWYQFLISALSRFLIPSYNTSWICSNVFHHIWAAARQTQQNGMCAQRRLRSAWAFTSLISLRCPHEETLGPELPTERTVKTLYGVQLLVFFCSSVPGISKSRS